MVRLTNCMFVKWLEIDSSPYFAILLNAYDLVGAPSNFGAHWNRLYNFHSFILVKALINVFLKMDGNRNWFGLSNRGRIGINVES